MPIVRGLIWIDVNHMPTPVTAPTTKLKKPVARLTAAERFNIYKRPHCPRCHAKIVRFLMGGRQVFACESCQIPPAD